MNKPLISYVVTAYNIENYIAESIECAFAQTYSPLEIVLSDDCSTDHTYEIMKHLAEKYAGPHKIVLNRNEKNLGITKHMNKVYLELAKGEIIIAAHGDDISKYNRTEVVADYLLSHPNCTQVACSAIVVDENLVPYSDYFQKNAYVLEEKTYEFGSGAHVSIGFSGFRREVMDLFGPLDESCPTEDDAIGFRAILLGNLAYLPEKLIKYRKHAGSNSNADQFYRFPLDEIYNQNIHDMKLAVKRKIISPMQMKNEQERLYKEKELRKVYRVYFANRTFKNLFKLLTYHGISFRRRLSYVLEHLKYMKSIF